MSMATMLSPSTRGGTLPAVTATARPYHHGNLRPALLAAAERALARGGELSLRELAREIGVSHAAPRRHFPDKQALLDALALDGFERLGREMAVAVEPGGEFREDLRALARAYVRFATEHAALLELMYAGKHVPGADALREAADRAFASPLALFTGAFERGEIDRRRRDGRGPGHLVVLPWPGRDGQQRHDRRRAAGPAGRPRRRPAARRAAAALAGRDTAPHS